MVAQECIHGFEAGLCDVCFPAPPPPRPVRATTATPARSRPAAARVQTQHDRRVYCVIGLAELGELVGTGELAGEPRWQAEASAWRRDDVVLVTSAAALGPDAVAVGDEVISSGAIPLSAIHAIGVASEPVRATVRGLLGGVAKPPRVLVHPPWFMPV